MRSTNLLIVSTAMRMIYIIVYDLNNVGMKVKFECVYVNSIHDKSKVT